MKIYGTLLIAIFLSKLCFSLFVVVVELDSSFVKIVFTTQEMDADAKEDLADTDKDSELTTLSAYFYQSSKISYHNNSDFLSNNFFLFRKFHNLYHPTVLTPPPNCVYINL